MIRFFKETLNPACFHGHHKRGPFFEGWYFKLVDAAGKHLFAVIPGIFLAKDPLKSHAFIQVFDGQTGKMTYHSYPIEDFHAASGIFDVRIAENRFAPGFVSLAIKDASREIHGDLYFRNINPWPVTVLSPGIMGWYAWAPFMQCYHGVVSLDHKIEGTLTIDSKDIDFTRGRGYTEKDWGQSFPECWIWFQSNHFPESDVSITASTAIIPWIRGAFPGFIVGFWHGRQLYKFATYTGAKIEELKISEKNISWVLRDRRHRLEMQAAPSTQTGLLQAPTPNGMNRKIAETLNASVEVQLSVLEGGEFQRIYSGAGRHAGMETVGDLDKLLAMWKLGTGAHSTNFSDSSGSA